MSVSLSRSALAEHGVVVSKAPVRIVHLGLGAFHRAHQAWYTTHARDGADWGIAAFTGRQGGLAKKLTSQDGLYTLVERATDGDRYEIIPSIVEAHSGANITRLVELLEAPETAIVTLTVTEAGYCATAEGKLNTHDPTVLSDMKILRSSAADHDFLSPREPASTPGRLLLGLNRRRQHNGGALTLVPCDNFPANGTVLRDVLCELATRCLPDCAEWIETHVSFVSTSVDRITPALSSGTSIGVAEATGWNDVTPVVTEPFADWVLSGDFPAGRPAWETAGAVFVDEIEPYESRKLWLLNGAHSLLAYFGRLRDHQTVADAVADPVCREKVESWWDEAERHLPAELGIDSYRQALRERFANPRIEHQLAQISNDGLTKIRLRIAPVARRERAKNSPAEAAAFAVATWITAVRSGMPLHDACHTDIAAAVAQSEPVFALLCAVAPDLAADPGFLAEVKRCCEVISANL